MNNKQQFGVRLFCLCAAFVAAVNKSDESYVDEVGGTHDGAIGWGTRWYMVRRVLQGNLQRLHRLAAKKNGQTRLIFKEKFIMKRMNVEAAREARLWITRVIFPTVVVSWLVLSQPEVREKIKRTFSGVGQRFSTRGD